MRFIVTLVFSILFQSHAVQSEVLYVELSLTGNDILVSAQTSSENRTFIVDDFEHIAHQSLSLIEIVSRTNRGNKKIHSEITKLIESLSRQFIDPMEDMIESASLLNIAISEVAVRIPFEFFKFNGENLYLRKPIVFSHEMVDIDDLKVLQIQSGFIVQDPTCDPENACGEIRRRKANSKFYSTEKTAIDSLRTDGSFDFILWSVHGGYHAESTQSILSINEELFNPKWILPENVELIYFDSCDAGKGINIVNHFTETGANYFIGPIISNESGNSSTKTILSYFGELESKNPVQALIDTKKYLTQYAKGNSLVELWYAAPFRLYKLN